MSKVLNRTAYFLYLVFGLSSQRLLALIFVYCGGIALEAYFLALGEINNSNAIKLIIRQG